MSSCGPYCDVIRLMQLKFGLPPEALLFHNHVAPKSCPGTAIDFNGFVAQLRAHVVTVGAAGARGRGKTGPFGDVPSAADESVDSAIRALIAPTGARAGDPPDAELDYGDELHSALIESARDAKRRGEELDAAMIERTAPPRDQPANGPLLERRQDDDAAGRRGRDFRGGVAAFRRRALRHGHGRARAGRFLRAWRARR